VTQQSATLAARERLSQPAAASGRSPWELAWARLRRDKVAMASAVVLAVILFGVTLGAPIAGRMLAHGPNDPYPYAVDFYQKPVGPWTRVPDIHSATADDYGVPDPPDPKAGTTLLILGGDGVLGRDLFLRTLYGGRVSLEVALGAALLAVAIGAALGSAAAFFGGWIDSVVGRLSELAMAFPVLLLLIMLGSVGDPLDDVTLWGALNRGVVSLIVLIAAFTWFYPARIVRSRVLTLRDQEFVLAAEMVGSRSSRTIRSHLLPHVVPELLVYGTLMVATNIMLEAGVSFLNAGIKLPTASWGTLLSSAWGTGLSPGQQWLWFQPWLTIVPSLAIFLTVLAVNQLGEALGDALGSRPARAA
jgi:peptide/nickel transport system permease protein